MNRLLIAGAVVALMFSVFGCKKEKGVNTPSPSTPTTPYVDTVALLTGHPWYWRWVGRDDNKDGEMDSVIYPYWQNEVYTIKADKTMCMTGYIADTVFFNVCGNWHLMDTNRSWLYLKFDSGSDFFQIRRINDTSMVTFDGRWKIFSATPLP